MPEDAFARSLSEAFRLPASRVLRSTDAEDAAILALELRREAPGPGMTGPMREDAAQLLCVHLRDVERIEWWADNRSSGIRTLRAGLGTIHDLRRRPFLHVEGSFHILAFRIPDGVSGEGSGAIDDPVLANLARSLLPFLDGSVRHNQRCVAHTLQAIAAHAIALRGDATPDRPATPRGGLAPWQQRRAQDLLRRHLVDGISLDAVAQACSLSSSSFLRAFRQSVGIPPHQWLLRCRVDRAAELLRDDRLNISEIALSSGFFDQSHFTRAFSQRMGLSPGAWRKAQAGAA